MAVANTSNVIREKRTRYLRGLIGLRIAAHARIQFLQSQQCVGELSVSDEEQLEKALKAVRYVNRQMQGYSIKGIRCGGQDLATLMWWPSPADIARVVLKIGAYNLGAGLHFEGVDMNKIDLNLIDLARFDLAKFEPKDYML